MQTVELTVAGPNGEPAEFLDIESLPHSLRGRERTVQGVIEISALAEDRYLALANLSGIPQRFFEIALTPTQRSKCDRDKESAAYVFHQLDDEGGRFHVRQATLVVNEQSCLLIHAGATRVEEKCRQEFRQTVGNGAASARVLHSVLSLLTAEYLDLCKTLEDELAGMEDIALNVPGAPIQRQLYRVKQRIAKLRRYISPFERLTETIKKGARPSDEAYRTGEISLIHEQAIEVLSELRSMDEMAQGILELTNSQQAAELNDVNKKLTAWAAIFAVGALIVGAYGMNFDLVPGDENDTFGFWFALALIGVLSTGLFRLFRKKRWL